MVTYTYEADSTLKRITNAIGAGTVSHDYGYNRVGQVTSKTATPATYEWMPHTLVNDTATVNALNQFLTFGGASISYDGNGNLLTDGVDVLTWNKENRLTKVTRSGSVIGEYSYDPIGRRSEKTANQTSVTVIPPFLGGFKSRTV